MENINLDVAAVLEKILSTRANQPAQQAMIFDFLRLVLNRQTFTAADLQAALQPLQTQIGALMGRLDDKVAELSGQLDTQTEQMGKSFREIRAALDKALESQITQEELDAAVAAAKQAQQAEDQAAADAAVDAAFAPLQEKLAAQASAVQTLDDIVPDEPAEPPVEPTEPSEPAPPAEPVG